MESAVMLHEFLAIVLFLLLLVAVFAALAQKIQVPYPIVLVVAGLIISLVPHVPRIPLAPDLVFLIFLPPLLYAAAWQTNWREFRFNIVSISMLALGLVAFTVLGVAFLAGHVIQVFDWKSGFLLGAVVSTTDAIAATSIARSVGLPRRITDILEGESLLNDATGLLALEFGLALLLTGQPPTPLAGTLRLLWLIGGGLGVGLLSGVVVAWAERWISDGSIEMVISIVVPYTVYLAGERIRASGVLAVVACGLFLSRRGGESFSPETRIQLSGAWSALTFMLNGLVFVLIGLQLPYVLAGIHSYGPWTLLRYGLMFSLLLIVLRLLWMYPAVRLVYWIRQRLLHQDVERPGPRAVFVVGWTGMRGVLALAAAISIPEVLGNGEPFGQRNLIIFLTFAVILVTLVVQGLTLPALIRALGLAGLPESKDEELATRRVVLDAALRYLGEQLEQDDSESGRHMIEDLLHRYEHRLEAVSGLGPGSSDVPGSSALTLAGAALGAVQVERRALTQLRARGQVGDDVARRLERELDLEEAKLGPRF